MQQRVRDFFCPTAKNKYLNILAQVSKHTLPFIFRYFAKYVNILFWGFASWSAR